MHIARDGSLGTGELNQRYRVACLKEFLIKFTKFRVVDRLEDQVRQGRELEHKAKLLIKRVVKVNVIAVETVGTVCDRKVYSYA